MTTRSIFLAASLLSSCASPPAPSEARPPQPPAERAGISPILEPIFFPERQAAPASSPASALVDPAPTAEPAPTCPPDTAPVIVRKQTICVDLYEIPNVKGTRPMVMIDAHEAEAWCAERGKTVVSEDAWVAACEGPEHWRFPYGNTWEPGRCNDDKRSIGQKEALLDLWLSGPDGREKAQAESDRLWQGTPSGEKEGCVGPAGVYDLVGNVEEWVVARTPRGSDFKHVLKGRFWAGGQYTCQKVNEVHADQFRYYEVGARCSRSLHAGTVQDGGTN